MIRFASDHNTDEHLFPRLVAQQQAIQLGPNQADTSQEEKPPQLFPCCVVNNELAALYQKYRRGTTLTNDSCRVWRLLTTAAAEYSSGVSSRQLRGSFGGKPWPPSVARRLLAARSLALMSVGVSVVEGLGVKG